MEDKVLNLENELESLEKNNPSLHIAEIKQIKKFAIKLEAEINNLLKLNDDGDDSDNNSDDYASSDIDLDIDIDSEINKYTKLINELNDESINLKSIEELNLLLKQIEKIEKNIINYKTLNIDLDIKTI
jgi:hypothetical protein